MWSPEPRLPPPTHERPSTVGSTRVGTVSTWKNPMAGEWLPTGQICIYIRYSMYIDKNNICIMLMNIIGSNNDCKNMHIMHDFGLLCIDASMGGWMGGWMDTRPGLFLQMEMMKMHESIPILGDGKWMKMAEWQWKRMTYNILGVSMLCQLACQFLSQVVTSKGIYPINTIGGINWQANEAYSPTHAQPNKSVNRRLTSF